MSASIFGYPPEEFVDTHYKLGQVLAAQANVSGENEKSRSHLQKTLGMRENYDKHMKDIEGQKKVKEHKAMVENLKRGDKVITSGGITGTVERLIDNDKVEVEIADSVKVEIVKATGIQGLLNTTQEVKK